MSVDYGEAIYGLRELQVAKYSGGSLGSWIDVPGRTLTYRVVINAAEQEANDRVIAVVREKRKAEFELEAGAYPLEAIEAMYGGSLTTTGTTPDRVKTLKDSTADKLPKFAIRGRAIGGESPDLLGDEGGGDMWVQMNLCYVTSNKEGSLQGGNWLSPTISGTALEHPTEGLLKEIQHETAQAFA